MKASFRLLSTVCITLLLGTTACRNNVYSPFYPYDGPAYEVILDSIQPIGRETVSLKGTVNPLVANGINDGYVGFYWSETPSPVLYDENQQLEVSVEDDGSFVGEIMLTPGTQYYLAAFAADEEKLYTSEVSEFLMPYPQAPIVPCTLPDNAMVNQGAVYDITSMTFREVPGGEFELRLSNSYIQAVIAFNELPANRTYISKYYSLFNGGYSEFVNVSLRVGFFGTAYSLKENTEVFVTEEGNGNFSVEICEGAYQVGSSEVSFQLRVSVPY